jgi:hypothetical protein
MKTSVFIEFKPSKEFLNSFQQNYWIEFLYKELQLNDFSDVKVAIDDSFVPIPVKKYVKTKDGKEKLITTYVIVANVEGDLSEFEKNKKILSVQINPSISLCYQNMDTTEGTDKDIETHLSIKEFKRNNREGENVLVAIVDGGIDKSLLSKVCADPYVKKPEPIYYDNTGIGSILRRDVSHGTMVAYDVLIAAPKCTLLDANFEVVNSIGSISNVFTVFLALNGLMQSINAKQIEKLKKVKSMVVVNSWAMYSIENEALLPANVIRYSNNPNHSVNLMIAEMARSGIDIVFAAGNCGDGSSDAQCKGPRNLIYGGNSHPDVFCVGGATVQFDGSLERNYRLGYSNKGPGMIENSKPDIAGYTHFFVGLKNRIPGFIQAHTGTSAACPVVAGFIAALRSVPLLSDPSVKRPEHIRKFIVDNAIPGDVPDNSDWNLNLVNEYKVINGRSIVRTLFPT